MGADRSSSAIIILFVIFVIGGLVSLTVQSFFDLKEPNPDSYISVISDKVINGVHISIFGLAGFDFNAFFFLDKDTRIKLVSYMYPFSYLPDYILFPCLLLIFIMIIVFIVSLIPTEG